MFQFELLLCRQTKAEEWGIFILPMPFMIDGETYFETIDLSQEQFYDRLAAGADIFHLPACSPLR